MSGAAILRRICESLIAAGRLWVYVPLPGLDPEELPGHPPEQPPPGHPEQLRPDIPLNAVELALQRQLER
jgi:hypothetical protein